MFFLYDVALSLALLFQLLIAFAQLLIVMTSLLMSSSLFVASSSRHADVMVAESRFLSISNADVIVAARSFFQ
ncbi:hypothetical protein F511_31692 [Dorcoceras hygrometricum]|uniref:Uncharacterized protein n=1 Tax=Dorcoceras hygrometricum TaxID=472368 RepID=A0A2Z7AG17_9LAMI|nr:hypothetical protein F511_31692 [Dorcoceras hygrometricum]